MFEGHRHILFDLLSAQGVIAPPALHAAFLEEDSGGGSFAERLIESGLIDRAALLRAVASHLDCDCIEPPAAISPEVLAIVGATIARSRQVVPLAKNGALLTLLAVDPLTPQLGEDLAFALNCQVRLAVADPETVLRLIRQYYGGEKTSQANLPLEAAFPMVDPVETRELTEADIEKMAGQTPIIRFVNQVLAQAIRDRASDVHFEPFA